MHAPTKALAQKGICMEIRENKKTMLTREFLAKPYQEKARSLQILCMIELALILLLSLTNALWFYYAGTDRNTPTSWCANIIIIFGLCMAFFASRWINRAQKRADEILNGNFSVEEDTVVRKWYDLEGDYIQKPHRYYEGQTMGQLEEKDLDEWNATERGDTLYLIRDKNRKIIGIYPAPLYAINADEPDFIPLENKIKPYVNNRINNEPPQSKKDSSKGISHITKIICPTCGKLTPIHKGKNNQCAFCGSSLPANDNENPPRDQ